MSQKVLQYIEIDIDYCSLTYGVSPCQARLDDTAGDSQLLLHFDGVVGSQTFGDSSPGAHGDAAINASPVLSAAVSKFGGTSLRLTVADTDYIGYADHADFALGSNDFTIDFWCQIDSLAAQAGLFGKNNVSATSGYFMFVNTNGSVQFSFNDSVLGMVGITTAAGVVTAGTLNHYAIVRQGVTYVLYINGVNQGSISSANGIVATADSILIGKLGSFPLGLAGYIDEFRFTNGLAYWPFGGGNFTPPTTAFGPATSDHKCFNTLVTCQDRPDFANVPVTLRFAVPTADLPSDIQCIPNINSIDFDPAVISLGENLGQRATLTVNFDDHRHSDAGDGFDKYLVDRDYDPYSQGTFWGKFRSRQPFLRNRNMRWITGFLGDALADMETRHYIIESFSGPDNNGKFQIIAKDLLKLADGDRALAPEISEGFLNVAITNSQTTAVLSPAGIGASYPSSYYAAIGGSEIVLVNSVSGDSITSMTRAQLGTAASAHSAQDRVQRVLIYSAASPDDIISNLLQIYAGVDASFLPLTDWATEVDTYLNRLYTAIIPQPTAVNELISELIEQAGLSMWWDDRNQEIQLLVLRGLDYTTYTFSEDNVMADSFEVEEQPDKRLSQVHTYFGQINPLTSLTDKANFRSVSKIINEQAETDYGSASIKEIFSRWIPALGRSIADRLGTILLSRFTDPPRHIKVNTLRASIPEVLLGRGYQVTSKFLQQDTGAPEEVNVQVTRLKPSGDVIQIEVDEVIYTAAAEDLVHRQIIVDTDTQNINLRTVHDLIFPTPDASITVICTINAGIRLSSSSPGLFSIDIGSWPAGVTIIVNILGGIRGAGGNGGNYNGAGSPGGTAIFTRVPIKLAVDASGTLWGGGGGGGGATYGGQASGSNLPGGAGGGAGIIPGSGGAGFGGSNGSPGTEFGGGAPGGPFFFSGTGGGPGVAGTAGFSGVVGGVFYPGFAGGAAGDSIDGVSFVTTGSYNPSTFVFTPGALAGSVAGPQIN